MVEIKAIMTPDPIFVTQHTNVHKARMLMADKMIRHIPIKNAETGELIGILGQKAVLANAIKIVNKRGFDMLEHIERSMDVASIFDKTPITVESNTNALEVAKIFKEKKPGCVAVVDNNKLVGIVTSSDFVELAVTYFTEQLE